MTLYDVGSIMRTDIDPLTPDLPIRRAVALLVESRSEAAAVAGDDGRLAGILTQKDCFRPVLQASYYREWTGRVDDFMTRKVVSVDAGDDVTRVAEMFVEQPYRVFPVVEGTAVVGLIHRFDVLAFLTRNG